MQPSIASLAVLLAACLSTPSSAQHPAEGKRASTLIARYFPTPKEGLSIKSDGNAKLGDILREFSRVTGQTLVASRNSEQLIDATSAGLNQPVSIPPAQVYNFIENLLSFHGFVLQPLSTEDPRLLGVASAQGPDAANVRASAIFVPAEELAPWAEHAATMITTQISLPHIDVRTLSNSMRAMFSDANTQLLMPVGNSTSLMITGRASFVVPTVSMLRRSDEEAAAEADARPQPPPREPRPQEKPVQEKKP